jgi:hypothetical protein
MPYLLHRDELPGPHGRGQRADDELTPTWCDALAVNGRDASAAKRAGIRARNAAARDAARAGDAAREEQYRARAARCAETEARKREGSSRP